MACWVCGEKNWSSTALIYGHIKRNHPGYRKGIAREYFANLRTKPSNTKVYSRPTVSSKVTSSSNVDSLSDSTSMDSYYSEYSTDMDNDGAPIFGSSLSPDDYEDFEEDYLVDDDGAPIVECFSPPQTTRTVIQQEKSDIKSNLETVSSYPNMSPSTMVHSIPHVNETDPSIQEYQDEDLILGI